MSTKEEIADKIVALGTKIRDLKAAKVSKAELDPSIAEYLALKESYLALNGGIAYDAPKVETVKKEKVSETPKDEANVKEGPSKKELNKLARKEKQQNWKANNKDGEDGDNSSPDTLASSAPVSVTAPVNVVAKTVTTSVSPAGEDGVYFNPKLSPPDLSKIVSAVLKNSISFFTSTSSEFSHLPYLSPPSVSFKPQHLGASSISGDANISRYLCRSSAASSADLYCRTNPWLASEVDQWLDIYTSYSTVQGAQIQDQLIPSMEKHFTDKTYAVGSSLTLADIAIFVLLKRVSFDSSFAAAAKTTPSLARFYDFLNNTLPAPMPLSSSTASGVNKSKSTSGAGTAAASVAGGQASATAAADDVDTGTCPPLEDAIEGQVVTRFPPEPSGYLHIGHAKAVLLNQYYAQRYKGKLLVRFDDTNPSKEKEEFEENILQDLTTLGVKWESVSHSSDHFAKCEEIARQFIKQGDGYMDDTDQETMQAERLKLQESIKRNTPVEENLKIFEDLLKGEKYAQKYCLRAKIDMTSVNGTMRDPVLYRFNETPHHRTGTKYKAYPTYDFVCPIIDSLEGVTHALRTTEYNDRDEQYYWIQKALKLRPVKIYSFGKMNFVHTVLSKRKLNWFVEQGLVEGWFDPRFPTIQGCVRRGVNVEALKTFILSQGASKRVITMEWDKFWAENKKVLEEASPRYMGVDALNTVELHVTNLSSDIEIVAVPIHPAKPELGTRVMRKCNKLYVDQADAATFAEGEIVTFLRWGNFHIDKIIKQQQQGGGGELIVRMEGRYDAASTDFKKTKKTTWLAAVSETVSCRLMEFDHLISKAKLGDDEDFKDFVNPISKKESMAICDPCLRLLNKGDVIQLERKGFFRVDESYVSDSKPVVLFAIPDGRVVKNKEVAAAAVAPTAQSKKK